MMSQQTVKFNSDELLEKSAGLRFNMPHISERATGFVVRYNGKPYAYLNQCAHVPVELDWQHGDFFNITKDYLICATHGAHYAPDTGYCVLGPCKGKRLKAIEVNEFNNEITINLESI